MPFAVPEAVLVTGSTDWGGQRERIVETDRGFAGTRWYLVNTDRVDHALSASGLPRRGERWSPSMSNLRVVTRTPEYIGNVNSSETDVGGWTGVEVKYETPGFSGRLLPREIASGDYTEIGWETRSTRIYYDARAALPVEEGGGPLNHPVRIDNGRGVDKLVASKIAVVHRYRPLDTPTPDALVDLAYGRPINSEELLLPPEEGASQPRTVAKLEAKFLGFERNVVQVVDPTMGGAGRGCEFLIRLELAPVLDAALGLSGHDAVWQREGPDGSAGATEYNWIDLRSDYRALLEA